MAEVRKLKTDPTRLFHQRLCGWIDPGKSGRVELGTLCSYVWPDGATNLNTIRKRCQTARKALAELVAVGWKLDKYAKGKWEIGRPKAHDNGIRPTFSAPNPHVNVTRFVSGNPAMAGPCGQFANLIQNSLRISIMRAKRRALVVQLIACPVGRPAAVRHQKEGRLHPTHTTLTNKCIPPSAASEDTPKRRSRGE